MMRPAFTLFVQFFAATCFAGGSIKADPDFTCAGFDYSGASAVKIGDHFTTRFIDAGGLIELRNERFFNKKLLPNHTWRGHFFLLAHVPIAGKPEKNIHAEFGFEHESSHPTMGIEKTAVNAYEAMYDGTYRNTNLNSLVMRLARYAQSGTRNLDCVFDYQIYLASNNTPELPGNTSANSHGISLGLDYAWKFTPIFSVYVSAFDRCIFRSGERKTDSIFVNTPEGYTRRLMAYPVINDVNTVTMKTGIEFHWLKLRRTVDVHCAVLYGNCFGFVDSRDNRFRVSAGFGIYPDIQTRRKHDPSTNN